MLQYTRCGWRATVSVAARPRPSRESGRRLLMKTSAEASRSSRCCRSSSSRRLSVTLRLPRLSRAKAGLGMSLSMPSDPNTLRMGSPTGASTLITSAPQSASSAAADGAATHTPNSTTRRPANAESPGTASVLTWPALHGGPWRVGEGCPCPRHHERHSALAEPVVGDADHRGMLDVRVSKQQVLDLGGIGVEATHDEHVFHPPDDPQAAGIVDNAEVTGSQPTVG